MDEKVIVDVQVATDIRSVPTRDAIHAWVEATIVEVNPNQSCEVSVRIVDEEEGLALNHQYRHKDCATNVLSFAADESVAVAIAEIPVSLGDVVICGPIVEKEASEQGKLIDDHWGHLLVHGVLHLLGYDHQQEAEALTMEAIETRILQKRGVRDPYSR